jgi:hypothetical protein
MEFFRHLWEMLTNNEASVPMAQVAQLLVINSFCLLFERFETGFYLAHFLTTPCSTSSLP